LSQRRPVEVLRTSKENMPSLERLKVTVLVDDSPSTHEHRLKAKHGLSLLIETRAAGTDSRILMDTGPTPSIALQNADILGIEMEKIDIVVLSHGHYDHTGGLIGILKRIDRPVPVVAHPGVFSPKFAYKPSLQSIGAECDRSLVRDAGGVLVLARNPVRIMNGAMTSGEIQRQTPFEDARGFWTVEGECFIADPIIDDQALFINVTNKGLVVITGCAHSGIINTARQGVKVTGVEDIYAIIGGLHLEKAEDSRIRASVDGLSEIDPAAVYPCHCTGSKAIGRLLDSFKDRCRPLHTGDVFEI
jgi:7,8-dihydropterin-6-yl-methyl-4-(beta-D-ribofuranosyl)aminobenzene 5'-phosphate synthase